MKVGDLVRYDYDNCRDRDVGFGFGVIIDQVCSSWRTEFLVLVADDSSEHKVNCLWFLDEELELIETST